MKASNLLVVIGLSGLATLSMPVAAADAKTFPGSMCQPAFQNTGLPVARDDRGRIFNPNSAAVSYDCPIVRETMAAKSNGIISAFARVLDKNSGAGSDVFCELWSESKDNDTNFIIGRSKTTGSDPGYKPLIFGSLRSSTDGYYHLFCQVPGKQGNDMSGIVMYSVTEAE